MIERRPPADRMVFRLYLPVCLEEETSDERERGI